MGKQPKSYEEWNKENEKSFNDFVNSARKEYDDFVKETHENFEKSRDKSKEKFRDEVRGAKERVAQHIGTDISAVCDTLTKQHGFDLGSMKVTTIGKGNDMDVVVACNNGIAIGKGDTFYVAQDAGGMATLTEVNIKSGVGMLMGKTNEKIDIMDSTLDKMNTVYPAMGFDNKKMQDSLKFAAADVHSYKLAMQGIDPIAIWNSQQKDK